MSTPDARPDHGFDAPDVPLTFAAAGLSSVVIAVDRLLRGSVSAAMTLFAVTFWFGLLAGSYLYTTRVGKFRVWAEPLDGLKLRGDERLLDVGCGRGAVLLLAAARLARGRASAIDLWSTHDQSGNAEAVTRRNAELAGVADRVALNTGDMRALPFPGGSFDVVVSSLAIHNVPDAAGRAQAIDEIFRVLRPGGRVLLADVRFADSYAARLREAGAIECLLQGTRLALLVRRPVRGDEARAGAEGCGRNRLGVSGARVLGRHISRQARSCEH